MSKKNIPIIVGVAQNTQNKNVVRPMIPSAITFFS